MWQGAIVLGIQMAGMFSLLPWFDGPQGEVAFFSCESMRTCNTSAGRGVNHSCHWFDA